jgi:hypothetical protein
VLSYTIIKSYREFPKNGKQNFITELISKVLEKQPTLNPFPQFINKTDVKLHGQYYDLLLKNIQILEGDLSLHLDKQKRRLECDAYFPEPWNFIFEFD